MEAVMQTNKAALEGRARRAAKRVGLLVRKSRQRVGTNDNHGGFCLVDPFRNAIAAGERFDLTAADVVTWCREA